MILGLLAKNKNVPNPTQTSDKLLSKVACVAVDSIIATFQTMMSVPKINPHNTENRRYLVLGSLKLDRKSTRLNSSHVAISYAVFCLKKKTSTTACAISHRSCSPV